MDHVHQIVRTFHDEHLATLTTLERFGTLLHTLRAGFPEDPAAAGDITRVMGDIEALIASDLVTHFDFEENSLFPVLEAAGYGEIGELLAEEHDSIRVTAGQLAALCHAVRVGTAGETDWHNIRQLGFEFVSQMTSHIQKEEMGLLTELDAAVDEDRDTDLVMAYSDAR